MPWFWSDQGKHKLQIAGLLAGADEVIALPQPDVEPAMLLFRQGRLAAVETINALGIHMAARRLIDCDIQSLLSHDFDLKAATKWHKASGTTEAARQVRDRKIQQ